MHFDMEFSFPSHFSIFFGNLKKVKNGKSLIPIDIAKPIENLITLNKIDYYFTPLTDSGNKGGNSIILKLFEAQEFNTEEVEYGIPDKILKISNSPYKTSNPTKSNKRFSAEIDALESCKKSGHQNIIITYENGLCKIFDLRKERYFTYQFYTMEFAKFDLKDYIESYHDILGLEEKIELCISLSEGLKELVQLGYYHRDLKPDNIFFTEYNQWKIGDLGLSVNRESDSHDEIAEFIGPRGWLTPEAMNKFLCENKGFSFTHPCSIDHQSDIFQLGKIFWYIFQHNVPIGSVKESDFQIQDSALFCIIKTMLSHSKKRRYKSIDEVIKLLKIREAKLLRQRVA